MVPDACFMHSRGFLLALVSAVATAAFGSTGCAAPTEEDASSSADSAYTVPNGAKYVVSANPQRVVLRKEADGRTFPFAAEELVGKAILIHPIDEKTEQGVYAWVRRADERAGTFELAIEPLGLEEMEEITEPQIVRIYLDRSLSQLPANGLGTQSAPFGLGASTIRPLGWGGLLTGELPLEGEIGHIAVAPRVKIWQQDGSLSFRPQGKVGWQRGRGLELGFRVDYAWESTLAFEAELRAGMVFETPRVRTPRTVVAVPIGPVPVPVTLGLAGSFECKALGAVEASGAIKIKIDASVGGSSFIKPSTRLPPTQWVTQGSWPYAARGTASVRPEGRFQAAPGAEAECLVPRIDLETLVAGVAGPFITLAPAVEISGEGVEIGVELKAGVEATLLGREARGEVVLLSWRPE